MRGVVGHEKGVAIGRSARRRFRANRAASARPRFDDELLTERRRSLPVMTRLTLSVALPGACAIRIRIGFTG
jgi:hypothetical protein